MKIGYGRTSTSDQLAGLEAQIEELKAVGCEEVFSEQASALGRRPQLDEALRFARKGDVLVITKLDRLARSTRHLLDIVEQLHVREVALEILSMNLDTATPTGRLMLSLLGSIAEFERDLMLERQRAGIARAQAEGKYRGRKPTARAKAPQILALQHAGMGASAIAAELALSRASVYRVLKEAKTTPSLSTA